MTVRFLFETNGTWFEEEAYRELTAISTEAISCEAVIENGVIRSVVDRKTVLIQLNWQCMKKLDWILHMKSVKFVSAGGE